MAARQEKTSATDSAEKPTNSFQEDSEKGEDCTLDHPSDNDPGKYHVFEDV